jgi:hypothetical protein
VESPSRRSNVLTKCEPSDRVHEDAVVSGWLRMVFLRKRTRRLERRAFRGPPLAVNEIRSWRVIAYLGSSYSPSTS